MKPKASQSASRRGVLGVHPVLMAVAAIVLVLAGAVVGAWFNVSQRPTANSSAREEASQAVTRAQPEASRPPRYQPPPFLSLNSEKFGGAASSDPRIDGVFSRVIVDASEPEADPALVEPAPVEANSPPMVAYAIPSHADPALPAIAIVIDDMGLDRTRSQRVLDLPGPLTLSFLTYAQDLQGWADKARTAGHEVMVHVPMQPLDEGEDPGPHALTMAMSPSEIAVNLHALLDDWHGYVGINNHMGSRLTADPERMAAVMTVLNAKGLLWLDSRTTADTRGEVQAASAQVPHLARDVFLDNDANVAAIATQLAEVERLARERGTAVAIGHPHEATRDALAVWLNSASERGLAIVPVTEIVRHRTQAQTRKNAQNTGSAG